MTEVDEVGRCIWLFLWTSAIEFIAVQASDVRFFIQIKGLDNKVVAAIVCSCCDLNIDGTTMQSAVAFCP